MRIALIQQKATNDKAANIQKGFKAADEAAKEGAQLICFFYRLFNYFLCLCIKCIDSAFCTKIHDSIFYNWV